MMQKKELFFRISSFDTWWLEIRNVCAVPSWRFTVYRLTQKQIIWIPWNKRKLGQKNCFKEKHVFNLFLTHRFNEFFNQRRRWVPSTIANIFDLLRNYKATVKINENISVPYIGYQVMIVKLTIMLDQTGNASRFSALTDEAYRWTG